MGVKSTRGEDCGAAYLIYNCSNLPQFSITLLYPIQFTLKCFSDDKISFIFPISFLLFQYIENNFFVPQYLFKSLEKIKHIISSIQYSWFPIPSKRDEMKDKIEKHLFLNGIKTLHRVYIFSFAFKIRQNIFKMRNSIQIESCPK